VNEQLDVLYSIKNREETATESLARKHVQNVRESFPNILKKTYARETG